MLINNLTGPQIGEDREEDAKRYHVTETGMVVVPEGASNASVRGSFDDEI